MNTRWSIESPNRITNMKIGSQNAIPRAGVSRFGKPN